MNIYVTDDLEAAMAPYRDALNWSSLAQEAFQRAIKLEQMKEVSMEESQLQRLRESRAKVAEREEAEGEAAGKKWALEEAEYDELKRVAELNESLDVIEETAYCLAAAILDEERPDFRRHADEFEKWFGTESPSDAFAEGFIRGAAEVYDEV